MYIFKEVNYQEQDINGLFASTDSMIFHTRQWIEFVQETKNAKPILLEIIHDGEFIGFYSGLIFSICGLKIVGSPFRGWTTLYMGFNLIKGEERIPIIQPLWQFLHKQYKCFYSEIVDWRITVEAAEAAGLQYGIQETYVKEIADDLGVILKSFSSTCKNQIHRFERNNATIEQVQPDDTFAELYYEQLKQVFGYQNLTPSYDLLRVKALLKHLSEIAKNTLYCTIAYNPDKIPIGTLIGFAYQDTAYLWGLTIIREEIYFQSDALLWDSFRHWKEIGCVHYDLVGVRSYKEKFHPDLRKTPRITYCRVKNAIKLRDLAEKVYWRLNKIKSAVKHK
ncbi:MAG: hypothetical protein PHG06_19935 [Parabacteroides sp.]|nr:hypothetical protein [Parabacteroides sp.]